MLKKKKKDLAAQYNLKKNASKSTIGNAIYSDYMTQLNALNSNYGITPSTYDTARRNIINSLKYYGYM